MRNLVPRWQYSETLDLFREIREGFSEEGKPEPDLKCKYWANLSDGKERILCNRIVRVQGIARVKPVGSEEAQQVKAARRRSELLQGKKSVMTDEQEEKEGAEHVYFWNFHRSFDNYFWVLDKGWFNWYVFFF